MAEPSGHALCKLYVGCRSIVGSFKQLSLAFDPPQTLEEVKKRVLTHFLTPNYKTDKSCIFGFNQKKRRILCLSKYGAGQRDMLQRAIKFTLAIMAIRRIMSYRAGRSASLLLAPGTGGNILIVGMAKL